MIALISSTVHHSVLPFPIEEMTRVLTLSAYERLQQTPKNKIRRPFLERIWSTDRSQCSQNLSLHSECRSTAIAWSTPPETEFLGHHSSTLIGVEATSQPTQEIIVTKSFSISFESHSQIAVSKGNMKISAPILDMPAGIPTQTGPSPRMSINQAEQLSQRIALMRKNGTANPHALKNANDAEITTGALCNTLRKGSKGMRKATKVLSNRLGSYGKEKGLYLLPIHHSRTDVEDREFDHNRRLAEGHNLSKPKVIYLTGHGKVRRKPMAAYDRFKLRKRSLRSLVDPFSDDDDDGGGSGRDRYLGVDFTPRDRSTRSFHTISPNGTRILPYSARNVASAQASSVSVNFVHEHEHLGPLISNHFLSFSERVNSGQFGSSSPSSRLLPPVPPLPPLPPRPSSNISLQENRGLISGNIRAASPLSSISPSRLNAQCPGLNRNLGFLDEEEFLNVQPIGEEFSAGDPIDTCIERVSSIIPGSSVNSDSSPPTQPRVHNPSPVRTELSEYQTATSSSSPRAVNRLSNPSVFRHDRFSGIEERTFLEHPFYAASETVTNFENLSLSAGKGLRRKVAKCDLRLETMDQEKENVDPSVDEEALANQMEKLKATNSKGLALKDTIDDADGCEPGSTKGMALFNVPKGKAVVRPSGEANKLAAAQTQKPDGDATMGG